MVDLSNSLKHILGLDYNKNWYGYSVPTGKFTDSRYVSQLVWKPFLDHQSLWAVPPLYIYTSRSENSKFLKLYLKLFKRTKCRWPRKSANQANIFTTIQDKKMLTSDSLSAIDDEHRAGTYSTRKYENGQHSWTYIYQKALSEICT